MATKTMAAGHGGPSQPTGGTSSRHTTATTTWSRQARSGVSAARPSGSAISAAATGMANPHRLLWSSSSWVLNRNMARAASHRTGVR